MARRHMKGSATEAGNILHFDGEARHLRDRNQQTLGALRREGFQPARRHPSAVRHRYKEGAQTDDELGEEPCCGVSRQRSLDRIEGVRRDGGAERTVRREYSNESVGQRKQEAQKWKRSLSAPPVRVRVVIPEPSTEQVC